MRKYAKAIIGVATRPNAKELNRFEQFLNCLLISQIIGVDKRPII